MLNSRNFEIDGVGCVLFEYSRRARHISISCRPFGGVRVTVPRGTCLKKARKLIEPKISWIRKQATRLKKLELRYRRIDGVDTEETKDKLILRTRELSRRHSLPFGKLSVRKQRTRWGSCSTKNNISLNRKLVHLPLELSDYIILHELLHTRIKNHRPAFWKELDKLVGDAKGLDRKMRKYIL